MDSPSAVWLKQLVIDFIQELDCTGYTVSGYTLDWSTYQVTTGKSCLFLNKRVIPSMPLEIIYQTSFAGVDNLGPEALAISPSSA